MMAINTTPRIAVAEPVMVAIPQGWFSMGCETGREDERPVHRVWVDAFELGAYQVTNVEYGSFLGATGHAKPFSWNEPHFNGESQPVVSVSWFDAVAYCEWLIKETGKHYRLPTEAQWERAARGGLEAHLYPWCGDGPEQVPDYATRWKDGPEAVGLYAPNPYGLYNMGDNVHEWCFDWYDASYYQRSPEKDPQGPSGGVRRASRGGSWRHHVKVTRTAARSSIPPEFKYADYGFRVARALQATSFGNVPVA
jgi:formylglycine-generating enzyme required for sulfatase activity